jgi:hypothetical protein
MRKIVVAVFVVMAVLGTSAGIVLGTGSTASIKASANFQAVQMHRVSARSGAVAQVAAKRHRAKVIYLESAPFTLVGGDTKGATATCPRRSKAINGYFGENKDTVFPILNSVGISLRKWSIAVHNEDAAPDASVFIGAICLKP